MTGQLGWMRHRDPFHSLRSASTSIAASILALRLLGRPEPSLHTTADMARAALLAVALITATTLCLLGVRRVVDVHHISVAYLVPVLVAAISLGVFPAVLAAVGGAAVSAFLFYPPLYDLRISDPQHVLDLLLFIIVATVTGQLATHARSHAMLAQERERETRAMYAFSKRLAVATDAAHIYSAIQDHLTSTTGCPVLYFEPDAQQALRGEAGMTPSAVWSAVREFSRSPAAMPDVWVDDEHCKARWLLRPVSRQDTAFGLIAIDFAKVAEHERTSMRNRIDTALEDAIASLGRLDMARVIEDAKLRAEAETLRAALISSVSHELRTPLASIMGSASILARAPAVMGDSRLAALAGIVREESERLNYDIQKLLDATQISSAGVTPQMDSADPADIINAAVERQRTRLDTHRVVIDLPEHLPLVHVDPVLLEQALGLILDNAAKYSPAGSSIGIEVRSQDRDVAIIVRDDGIGLTPDERNRMFERFFRGARAQASAPGSGLGLWIARAFAVACDAQVTACSEGIDRGTTIAITIPQSSAQPAVRGDSDE